VAVRASGLNLGLAGFTKKRSYPLVNIQKAIENGDLVRGISGFTP